MSVNWSKKDFASKLRTTTILATKLRVGDIVYEDGNPIGIAKVWRQPDGRVSIQDEDMNGWTYLPKTSLFILPRATLRKSRTT